MKPNKMGTSLLSERKPKAAMASAPAYNQPLARMPYGPRAAKLQGLTPSLMMGHGREPEKAKAVVSS